MLIRTIACLVLSFTWIFDTSADEAENPKLEVAIQKARLRTQREVIQLAAKPMFNNVNDWQRWVHQVNDMGPHQLNGLMNILNGPQRQFLTQRQDWISQLIRRQWIQQQLWMQQNAMANLPFGMMPWGFNQPRIYYAPIVQWLPQGVQFNVGAVVSPDRRHVRMNLNPIFSSIGPVYHYNMRNGAYYQPQTYRQPWGSNSTIHGGVQRANYSAPTQTQSTRRLPDWYLKNRNNP